MKNELKKLTHLFVTIFISAFAENVTLPAMTDVTMTALCPGKNECSLPIYLSGFQQVVGGLGSVFMTPLIGNLSDVYGRKSLLTPIFILYILPYVALAYKRESNFFYANYALNTLIAILGGGSTICICFAYVADNISETKRGAAFGVLTGVMSAAFVCGTTTARFLTTAQTFQVATASAVVATVYMLIFLKETRREADNSSAEPLLKSDNDSKNDFQVFKHITFIQNVRDLLKNRTFSQVAVIALIASLANGGVRVSWTYFLKAQFHFTKDQYAYVMLIVGITGTVSQLILMPTLVPRLGEDRLLKIGLFTACASMFLKSIAWDVWVVYVVSGFSLVVTFSDPCLRSIASKQVGTDDQGKVQGCLSGMESLSRIISPFIFSPLTATFLAEKTPFYYPGFSLFCTALCMAIAFIQSLMVKATPNIPTHNTDNKCTVA